MLDNYTAYFLLEGLGFTSFLLALFFWGQNKQVEGAHELLLYGFFLAAEPFTVSVITIFGRGFAVFASNTLSFVTVYFLFMAFIKILNIRHSQNLIRITFGVGIAYAFLAFILELSPNERVSGLTFIFAIQYAVLIYLVHVSSKLIYPNEINLLNGCFSMVFVGNAIMSVTTFFGLRGSKYFSGDHEVILVALIILAGLSAVIAFIMIVAAKRQRKLLYFANYDGLTGILRRNAFNTFVEKILTQSTSNHFMLMVDIDHFKKVNDTYGHEIGDQALKHVTSIIKEQLREDDLFCRHGGEEFVIFIPNGDLKNIHQISERVRKAVESSSFMDGETEIPMTISIGLGQYNTSLQDTILQVDEALFEAKNAGRNRVVSNLH